MPDRNPERRPLIARRELPAYLLETHGVRMPLATLHDRASRKLEPRYCVISGRAYYDPDHIDAWIDAQRAPAAPDETPSAAAS